MPGHVYWRQWICGKDRRLLRRDALGKKWQLVSRDALGEFEKMGKAYNALQTSKTAPVAEAPGLVLQCNAV